MTTKSNRQTTTARRVRARRRALAESAVFAGNARTRPNVMKLYGWRFARVIAVRCGRKPCGKVRIEKIDGDDRWKYARTANDVVMKVGYVLFVPPTLTLKVRIGDRVRVEIHGGAIVAIGRASEDEQ